MRVVILTNNLEVDNNVLKESHEAIYNEHAQVANLGSGKRVYNLIVLILSYEYKKKDCCDGGA